MFGFPHFWSKQKGIKEKMHSIQMNELAYQFYWNTLTMLACSIYEWKGLPETVDLVELEKSLLFNTKTLVFVDEVVGLLSLPFNSNKGFDAYGYPTRRLAYSKYTHYRIARDRSNSVVVYDNVMRQSTLPTVQYYANRLWNLDRIVDVNCNAQKTPVLLVCDKDTKMSVKNAYQEFDGNMSVIASYKNFNTDSIKALSTDAPFVAPQMNELKQSVWNDFLTAVGVPNVNVNKKERLLVDEVMRGSGGSIACRYPRLNARKEACKRINMVLGDYTDGTVDCDFKEELIEEVRKGVSNGEIHTDPSRNSVVYDDGKGN